MNTPTYVTNTEGDWEAIYIDGKLHHEGYSIPAYVYLLLPKQIPTLHKH